MTAAVSHEGEPSMLLDGSASERKARALRSWSLAQRNALALRFVNVVAAWRDEWLPAQVGEISKPSVEVFEPNGMWRLASEASACWSFEEPRRASSGVLPALDGASAISVDERTPAMRAIADRMFAIDTGSGSSVQAKAGSLSQSLAGASARKAWDDWMRRIDIFLDGFDLDARSGAGVRNQAPPAAAWSGALCVRAAWCGGEWTLALPWEAVVAAIGPDAKSASRVDTGAPSTPQAKTRLDHALADRRVTLRVMLEGAQLNLGQIQALRVGDVVPLSHRLDAPTLVVGSDGRQVCDGWLGQSGGHLAVELSAPLSSAQAATLASPPIGNGSKPNIHSSKGSFK